MCPSGQRRHDFQLSPLEMCSSDRLYLYHYQGLAFKRGMGVQFDTGIGSARNRVKVSKGLPLIQNINDFEGHVAQTQVRE